MATFSNQPHLPSLPVPELEETIERYLISARVHLTEVEYDELQSICRRFVENEGRELQRRLVAKGKTERNWLEQWWFESAYLSGRYPIFPYTNFGGFTPSKVLLPDYSSQIDRASQIVYFASLYWNALRMEKVPIMKYRDIQWCMRQAARIYNTCRIPQPHCDRIDFHFKTVVSAVEGYCPSHVIVNYRGNLWRLDTHDFAGVPYTPSELSDAISSIRNQSLQHQPSLFALTALDREKWALTRDHFRSLSDNNRRCLDLIETSILVLVLTDLSPSTYDELDQFSVFGDCRLQYADKSMNHHVHANGMSTSNCDHTPADAIVPLQYFEYLAQQCEKVKMNQVTFPKTREVPFERLLIEFDDRILQTIDEAIEYSNRQCSTIDMECLDFNQFGADACKSVKAYGDTVVQMAIQLTYFKIHQKPGATYETASTRKFYHGRTETLRSCTVEAMAWCASMVDPMVQNHSRRQLLREAIKRHDQLMATAMDGMGVDRHLLGLRLIAKEAGMADPELFTHSSWKKSGGDGNYVISTSYLGANETIGAVLAMCTDGYGTFYRVGPKNIKFTITTFNSSKLTDLKRWRVELLRSLMDVIALLNSSQL